MWTPAEAAEFSARLSPLCEYFGKPLNDEQQEIYLRALEDLPLDAVLVAMNAAIQTCTFLPKVAELRKLATGSTEDQAELAWGHVLDEVRRVGAWGVPERLTDAELRTVEQVFGSWVACCRQLPAPGGDEAAVYLGLAKQFKALHQAQARQDGRPALGPSRQEAAQLAATVRERVKHLTETER